MAEQDTDNRLRFVRWLAKTGRINEGYEQDGKEDTLRVTIITQKTIRQDAENPSPLDTFLRSLTDLTNWCLETEREIVARNIDRGDQTSSLPGKPWQDRQILGKGDYYERVVLLSAFTQPNEVEGLRLEVTYRCLSSDIPSLSLDGLRLYYYGDSLTMTDATRGVLPDDMFYGQPPQTIHLYSGRFNFDQNLWALVRKARMVLLKYLQLEP